MSHERVQKWDKQEEHDIRPGVKPVQLVKHIEYRGLQGKGGEWLIAGNQKQQIKSDIVELDFQVQLQKLFQRNIGFYHEIAGQKRKAVDAGFAEHSENL